MTFAENYEVHETKVLFEQYYSVIYYLFHDGFTNVEASLTQRGEQLQHWKYFCHKNAVAGVLCFEMCSFFMTVKIFLLPC